MSNRQFKIPGTLFYDGGSQPIDKFGGTDLTYYSDDLQLSILQDRASIRVIYTYTKEDLTTYEIDRWYTWILSDIIASGTLQQTGDLVQDVMDNTVNMVLSLPHHAGAVEI